MNTRPPVQPGRAAALWGLLALAELIGLVAPGTPLAEPGVHLAWLALLALLGLRLTLAERRRELVRLHALDELTRRARHPLDPQTLYDTALTRAVLLAEAQAGALRVADPAGHFLTVSCLNVHRGYMEHYRTTPPPEEAVRGSLLSGEPVLLPPDRLAPDLRELGPCAKAGPGLLVPIVAGGQLRGLIALLFPPRRGPRRGDLAALRVLGSELGTALHNAAVHERLLHEARTDPLTGLGSRRQFEEVYRRELARARRSGRPVSVALVDVDDMKQINDMHGHGTGDRVLQSVAEALRTVRLGDLVARIGGDEFVVLMPDTARHQAEALVRRVGESVAALNGESRFPFRVSVSIGLSESTGSGRDALAEADAEMYRKKRRRREADETPETPPSLPDQAERTRGSTSG